MHDERLGYNYGRIYADPLTSKKTPEQLESVHVVFTVSVGKSDSCEAGLMQQLCW
jgi:hypothetical protein